MEGAGRASQGYKALRGPSAGMSTARYSSTSKASDRYGKEAGSRGRGRPKTSQSLGEPVTHGALTTFFRRMDSPRQAAATALPSEDDALREASTSESTVETWNSLTSIKGPAQGSMPLQSTACDTYNTNQDEDDVLRQESTSTASRIY